MHNRTLRPEAGAGLGSWKATGLGATFALLAAGAFLGPIPVFSQLPGPPEVRTIPSKVRIGEPFELETRILLPRGWRLEARDSIAGLRGFHRTGPSRVGREAADSAGVHWTLTFPMLAVRTGYRPLPSLSLEIINAAGAPAGPVQVPLGGVLVQSLLPPPGQAVSPAPLLLPPQRSGDPRRLGALLLMAAGLSASGWWLVSKGRDSSGPEVLPGRTGEIMVGTTRPETELRELIADIPRSQEEATRIFEEAIPLLRNTLGMRLSRGLWGQTTPELLEIPNAGGATGDRESLERALRASDRVRFRRDPPTVEEARAFQAELAAWLDATPALESPLTSEASGD